MRERLDKPHARVRPATAAPPCSRSPTTCRVLRERRSVAVARSGRVSEASSRSSRSGSPASRGARNSASARWSWCSKATTPRARAAAIRRITHALDARQYTRGPDRGAHRRGARAARTCGGSGGTFPGHGHITIFDRSWYGRVLVERVEGFAPTPTGCAPIARSTTSRSSCCVTAPSWRSSGCRSARRSSSSAFEARETTAFKRFKITAEDWRNRKKWNAYEGAVADMIDRTSTEIAPWTIVEAKDKAYARVKILRTLGRTLEAAL